MLRLTVRLRRELGDLLIERHGLTMADYDTLVPLADRRDHGMRMADLADAILQPRSSLTRIADRLERRGLIRRERSAEDARGASAVVTDKGLAASDARSERIIRTSASSSSTTLRTSN